MHEVPEDSILAHGRSELRKGMTIAYIGSFI